MWPEGFGMPEKCLIDFEVPLLRLIGRRRSHAAFAKERNRLQLSCRWHSIIYYSQLYSTLWLLGFEILTEAHSFVQNLLNSLFWIWKGMTSKSCSFCKRKELTAIVLQVTFNHLLFTLIFNSCNHVVRNSKREAKIRCNF